MKAIVCPRYGSADVLQFGEVAKPVQEDNEVLIKIYATTVNRTDCAAIKGTPFFVRLLTGISKPKKPIPGTEFAGIVEGVGKNVKSFRLGDNVFGFDGLGSQSQAEYMTMPEDKGLTTMPENITYEEAAASTEGAHYAYSFINKLNIKSGQKVLVNGATGAIGSAAVQLLKYYEVQVTAVCSTKNIDLVKSLGADRVIDYTKEDFTRDTAKYNFVFDAVGKSSFFRCSPLLQPGGIYISSDLGFMAQNIVLPLVTPLIKPFIGNKKTVFPLPTDIRGSLALVKKLIEQRKFKAVIDRRYPLDQIVEAYRYVEQGQKIGNVVIIVVPDN